MNSKDVSERLLKFSVNVLKFCLPLNKNPIEKHIGLQLVRSSTSAGANYEESRGVESKSDFIHKMQLVFKELKESFYWIRLLREAGLGKDYELDNIMVECDELVRIIGKSLTTAKKNK